MILYTKILISTLDQTHIKDITKSDATNTNLLPITPIDSISFPEPSLPVLILGRRKGGGAEDGLGFFDFAAPFSFEVLVGICLLCFPGRGEAQSRVLVPG